MESGNSRPAGSRATILMVDDDELIRNLVNAILKGCGYEVLVADGGLKALQLGEQFRDDIDLLLADVIMPDLNGPEVAHRLRSLRPALKVLFMSGYTGNVLIEQGGLPPGADIVSKPFTSQDLAQRVRQVLQGAAVTEQN